MNQIHPEPLSGTLVDILEETAAGIPNMAFSMSRRETPRRSSRAIPNCCATPKRWRRCCIGAGSGPVRR